MNAKRALGLVALVVALAGLVASGAAVGGVAGQDGPPSTPAAYYGQVTVTDGELSDPVTVEAVVDGEVRDSIETDADGSFGGSGAFDEKLTVDGPADEVTFRVAGTAAGTATWESGANEEVALELAEAPDPDDGSDSGGETDPGDGSDGDPGDGDDGSDGGDAPGGGTGGAADTPGGDGGTDAPGDGGTDAPGDAPTDAPSVEDAVDVPEGATAVAGEAATAEPNADGTSSVAFSGETGVEGIDFGAAVEGDVGVVELDAAPESTGRPPGAGVSVVEITVPETARDTPATIRTRVSADRLTEAGADAEDLRLSRHSGGEWQALETTVVERDGDGVVLAAETPGFSVFSVSAVSEPESAIEVESSDVAPGETVTLSGAGSSDEYGEIVAYDWTIDGETATGSVTETTFAAPGEYTVELTVTNDAGETDSATTTVAVEPAEADEAAPVEEPGLFSLRTLGAVVGAFLTALLVVAAVRRMDR
jgi:PGF-pre-PGF domain-containing protein